MIEPLATMTIRTRNAYSAMRAWRAEVQALQSLVTTCNFDERDALYDQLDRANQAYTNASRRYEAIAAAAAQSHERQQLRKRGWG